MRRKADPNRAERILRFGLLVISKPRRSLRAARFFHVGGKGRGTVAISVHLRYNREELCLFVTDDGPGFPPDGLTPAMLASA